MEWDRRRSRLREHSRHPANLAGNLECAGPGDRCAEMVIANQDPPACLITPRTSHHDAIVDLQREYVAQPAAAAAVIDENRATLGQRRLHRVSADLNDGTAIRVHSVTLEPFAMKRKLAGDGDALDIGAAPLGRVKRADCHVDCFGSVVVLARCLRVRDYRAGAGRRVILRTMYHLRQIAPKAVQFVLNTSRPCWGLLIDHTGNASGGYRFAGRADVELQIEGGRDELD